ncbi:hypothetical protein FO519_003729 [Halicephalobus sp. NKZ332]|nr:hypothetical protein FO519_003729 [Halicephalobus sp. NKZ332]
MVYITKAGSEEKIPVPVDKDNLLPLQILERYFPGTAGLMYFEEDGTEKRPVSFDESMTKLVPPAEGWDNKLFYVIRPRVSSRPATPMATESRPTTSFEQDYIHGFDWVKPFLFYIDEETGFKSCVVSLTPHYLVTFRHGTHLSYIKFSTVVRVVSISSGKQHDAVVVHICEEENYVILKSNEEVVDRECPRQQCDVMTQFVVCGFAKGFPELTFIHGTVYSTYPFVYENNGKQFGPFIYGTAKTSPGDSGAACFGKSGLMALNLGTTTMPKKLHDEAISEAAIYSPNNYMIPVAYYSFYFPDEDPNPSSRNAKLAPGAKTQDHADLSPP